MNGGEAGQAGRQALLHGGKWRELPGSDSLAVEAGDLLRVETPGGGGWGK
jgi:N-methylhydantoinase B/oxoprolinase/acetone carboxylase alpha subunit